MFSHFDKLFSEWLLAAERNHSEDLQENSLVTLLQGMDLEYLLTLE